MSAPPVTAADLAHLADPRPDAPSGYHGVYPDPSGRTFQARFFQKKVCSGRPTPREAAVELVRHWKRAFGSDWRDVWYYRQTAGWVVWRGHGGWWGLAAVRAGGERAVLVGRHPLGPWGCVAADTPGSRAFPTEAAARRGVVRWAVREWGTGRRFAVRRTWTPSHSAARGVKGTG